MIRGGVLAVLLCAVSVVARAEDAKELTGYAGNESCMMCHEDLFPVYQRGKHGNKADPRTPAGKLGCESCHGPRAAHAEDGSDTGVTVKFGPKSDQPISEQNAACLTCHERGKTAMWDGSVHQRHDIACWSCHNPHAGQRHELVKPTETEVCLLCHQDIRAELLRTSHHPLREGKMNCSDCHNSHGTVADGLISANQINEKCYECHAEMRGPFLWQHQPVSEDCMSCHTAHGSVHDKLLQARAPMLCQRCHSNVRHPGTLYAQPQGQGDANVYSTMNNRLYYRSCMNCHVQVHGSNHPSGKALAR